MLSLSLGLLLAAGVYAQSTIVDYAGRAIGVDYEKLQVETGTIVGISVQVGESEVVFQYTAPDSKNCAVDLRLENERWSRTMDAGGARPRRVAMQITPNRRYQYRILCTYPQSREPATDFLAESAPGQVTSGVFATLSQRRR